MDTKEEMSVPPQTSSASPSHRISHTAGRKQSNMACQWLQMNASDFHPLVKGMQNFPTGFLPMHDRVERGGASRMFR